MTEEFVKLETAKLLKEKGFSENVFTFYEADSIEGDMKLSETYDESENFNEKDDCFSAPTQSLIKTQHIINHHVLYHGGKIVRLKTCCKGVQLPSFVLHEAMIR